VAEPVVVITRPQVHVHDADLSALEADAVVLTAEERRWGRRRVKTRAGRELQLALPTGSRLIPGDILYVARGWYARIEAAPEPVLMVVPSSFEEAVRIAFEVGNRHVTLGVDGGRLLIPDDPATVQLLNRLGVAFERGQAPFEPLSAGHRHE